MRRHRLPFENTWIVLVQVRQQGGDPLVPVMLMARSLKCDERHELDATVLAARPEAPYCPGPDTLLVTVEAQLLAGVHLALGWPRPTRVVDLAVEFKTTANGRAVHLGPTIAGALVWFGLPPAPWLIRDTGRDAAHRRLDALDALFECMLPDLDLGRALLRGRYFVAVANIEASGIPIDTPKLERLRGSWNSVVEVLKASAGAQYEFFQDGRFDTDSFETWLADQSLVWPRNRLSQLDLSPAAFRDAARTIPQLQTLKELLATLRGFDPQAIRVGSDSRNRAPLRPFASRTGRNQPSTKASIFGAPAWVRALIRPSTGHGLALIDWSQQEFGIAAALSGDSAMVGAYRSNDPYLAFAIAAGAAPSHATSTSHPEVRTRFKACALGVQYGIGPGRLGALLDVSETAAAHLLKLHRTLYPAFWRWSDQVEMQGYLTGRLQSVFGWQVCVDATTNPRFLRNFPMQANGAEMLRLACCLATEAGIRVCATLHDALLIEAPIRELDEAIARTQSAMAEASEIVLDGLPLRTTVRRVPYPQRLSDPRGSVIWDIIGGLFERDEAQSGTAGGSDRPARQRNVTCSGPNPRTILLYGSNKESAHGSD